MFVLDDAAKVGDIVGKVNNIDRTVCTAVNKIFAQVQAADLDKAENGKIIYSIKNATENLPVELNPETGDIVLTSLPLSKKK